jgi:hypothetical protein
MAIGRIPEPETGIPESIIAAKGDILTGTANDVPAVITVGANETRLVADSAAATGLKYVADTTNYAVAAKGDLLVGTAADTLDALSVGTNGHTLVADSATATGLKWAAPAGGGKVLQVIMGTVATAISSSTFTYVDTGLTATITPSATNSKVLVFVTHTGIKKDAGNTANWPLIQLLRAGTSIVKLSTAEYLSDVAQVKVGTMSMVYLDSPNTTSATIYKTQFQNPTNAASVTLNGNSDNTSTIVLMEIGA